MMILEHGDMGCGMAQLFHMPERGYSSTNPGGLETIEQYKERFLNTTVKQRRMFRDHQNSTMCTDNFSANGNMPDGTLILHLRTVRDWLFEYSLRPATMIVLGKGQVDRGLGEVLELVGFKKKESFENPIMGYAPVTMYIYPAMKREDAGELGKKWQAKLQAEKDAMEKAGLPVKAVSVSNFAHNNF